MPCSTALCQAPGSSLGSPLRCCLSVVGLNGACSLRCLDNLVFFSCCCCEGPRGGQGGWAPRGWCSSPSVRWGGDPPLPSVACVALSVPPRPPPGWQEGAPRVGAGLEEYTIPGQGRPAAPLPARPVAHSLRSRYLDPPGERGGFPGGQPDQGVLPSRGPCWSPAGSRVGALRCKSSALWQACLAAAGDLRAQDTVWLPAGPEGAGIPGGGTGLSRVGGSLCGRQSRTPLLKSPRGDAEVGGQVDGRPLTSPSTMASSGRGRGV